MKRVVREQGLANNQTHRNRTKSVRVIADLILVALDPNVTGWYSHIVRVLVFFLFYIFEIDSVQVLYVGLAQPLGSLIQPTYTVIWQTDHSLNEAFVWVFGRYEAHDITSLDERLNLALWRLIRFAGSSEPEREAFH